MVSVVPLAFVLLSSCDPKKRVCEKQYRLDKRSCPYQRRKEITIKATVLLERMVQRILSKGKHTRYPRMGSWFTMPPVVDTQTAHIHVIDMVKKAPSVQHT